MANCLHTEDFIATNLPKELPPLEIAPVEDGGDDSITVESEVSCTWGLLNHRGNNGYFANIPEELDTEGDLSKITQSSSWQAHVPGFESIPYERFGRIEVQAPTIVCPIHPEGEQFDTNLPFDNLFGQS